MERRNLGNDGFVTSALGLGCMGFSQGYGATDDNESLRAMVRAVEHGVTLLDTAMSYGQGHNERLIARLLSEHPQLGSKVEVATKFGIVRDDQGVHLDGRPDHVREHCEASLERLGVETVDLYYLHRVDPDVPIAETVGAMAKLVAEGKVRHLGVSEVTADQLVAAHAEHSITALQLEWSLLWREPETDVIPAARQLGVGLVPYSPLGRGLLTGTLSGDDIDVSDFRRSDPRFHGAELTQNDAQVHALNEAAAQWGLTAGQLALAWLLAQGPDVVPIPGSRRAARVAENAEAAAVSLTEQDLRDLEQALPAGGWAGDRQSFAVPAKVRSR